MSLRDVLLIDGGDLPSLALLSIQPDAAGVVLWHAPWGDHGSPARQEAARRHADAYSAADLVVLDHAIKRHGTDGDERPRLEHAALLIRALAAAAGLGCTRVLWPHHAGLDHRAMADAIEVAGVVSRLSTSSGDGARSGGGAGSITIDLPLIDLNDAQIVELADDAGAPMDAWWPCNGSSRSPCGACDGCKRWGAAMDEAGVAWPWPHQAMLRHS